MMCSKISGVFLFFSLMCTVVLAQNTMIRTPQDEAFRTGLDLFDKKKYAAAREIFSQYLRENSNGLHTIDAEYYIACCALYLYHQDAEFLFNEFTRKYPEHTYTMQAYLELGTFYFNEKKYEKAIEYLDKVNDRQLTTEQKNEFRFRLGYCWFTQKEFSKSLSYFNSIKNTEHKYTYAACYYAAYTELKENDFNNAYKDLKKAALHAEYQNLVPHMLCNLYYRQSKYNELIQYADSILSNNSKVQVKSEIRLMQAESYYNLKNYEKALEAFNQYLQEEKGSYSREIQYRKAYCLFKTNQLPQAIEAFKPLASVEDTIGQSASYFLGLCYLKNNQKEYALLAFDFARRQPHNKATRMEAHFYTGKLNYDLNRYHDAILAMKDFIKTYPGTYHEDEANEILTDSYFKTNNYSEAIAYIESLRNRTLRLNSIYQKLCYYKAAELFNNSDYTEALKMADKSLIYVIDKEIYITTLLLKADIYSMNKENEKAKDTYLAALQKGAKPNSEVYYKIKYGLGYIYYNEKNYEKAFECFKEYAEHSNITKKLNTYYDALSRLADLYYARKKYDEAVRYYTEIIENSAYDKDYAYLQRGIVLLYQDKTDKAKENFEQLIARYPASVYLEDAIYQKAVIDTRAGNIEAAIKGFSSLIGTRINNHPYEPYALLKRATLYSTQKKYEEALADYNTLLDVYATHDVYSDALVGAKELYILLDRTEEFTAKLKEYSAKNPNNNTLDDVEFDSMKDLYHDGKYEKCITGFESYLSRYPNSANAFDARYFLADAYYQTKDLVNADKNFQIVIQDRKSAYVTKALARMADIYRTKLDYKKANYYSQLYLQNAKSKKEKAAALQALMENWYMLAQHDSSSYAANEILKSANINANVETKAYLYLAKNAIATNKFSEANEYLKKIINGKDEVAAEANYLVAEIYYKQSKHKESLQTLYKLNNNFSEYEYWLGKSFLLIADNLISQKEYFQAKATLKSIIEHARQSEIVEAASKKLAQLNELESKTANENK
ncbi:MAG: tetratricopeptide repeat protein [Cytophagaceae bacterium]|nr:tetratricopeptide repeat protein [Cytophagaceae bacterium]MDW8456484.1 tetratricopeptide repeat protein [Cytophagaceae bacterium]